MTDLIGRSAILTVREPNAVLRFEVRILDTRELFGRRDVKVEPVQGTGSCWVNAERLNLTDDMPVRTYDLKGGKFALREERE